MKFIKILLIMIFGYSLLYSGMNPEYNIDVPPKIIKVKISSSTKKDKCRCKCRHKKKSKCKTLASTIVDKF